jgi:hypothetical protein
VLELEAQVPFLGPLLGVREVFFLGCDAVIAAGEKS